MLLLDRAMIMIVGVRAVAVLVGWIKYDMERTATQTTLAQSSGLNLQFAAGQPTIYSARAAQMVRRWVSRAP